MLLVLIFAVIILSGLVAYIGDQIGMKIGKKRLSLFGIRPKYTSIIITILTGILIATISISLLMLASKGVRMAVFDMERLIRELASLNKQVMEKDERLQQMADEISKTTALLADIRLQKDKYQTELDAKVAELTNKKAELGSKQAELSRKQKELDQKQNELNQKHAEYKTMEKRLTEAQTNYENLARVNMELEKSKTALNYKINEIELQKNELEKQKKGLEDEANSLTYAIATLNQELDNYSKRITEMGMEKLHLQLQSDDSDIVYRKGELIYIESMETVPGADYAKFSEIFNAYLDRANKIVQKRKVGIDPETKQSIKIEPEEFYEIYKVLTSSANETLLIALHPWKNIWVNDLVESTITWEKNYKVFTRNQLILEKELDATQDPKVLEQQLLVLLNQVSERSIQGGLITNASGEVGVIYFADIYNMIETIRQLPGKVKISVMAKKDIWRHERLTTDNIQFNVIPVENR